MEWYPELVYILLNSVPIFVVTYGISLVIVIHSLNLRVAKIWIVASSFIKLFFLNIGFTIVLSYFFEHSTLFLILHATISLLFSAWYVVWIAECADGDRLKVFFTMLLSDYFAMMSEGIVVIGVSMALNGNIETISNEKPGKYTLCLLLAGSMLVLLVWYIGKKSGIFDKIRNYKIRHRKLWWIICIGNLLLSYWYTIKTSFRDGSYLYQPYLIIAGSAVVFILSYLVYQKMRQRYLFRENQNLRLQQNLMAEYYMALQNQVDLTRKMRHDIANHMQTMETLASQNNRNPLITEYADSLRESYQRLERMNYCQNTVVDSVIYNKVKVCEEELIRTDIKMNLFEQGEIPEIEILSLLYNLFDNAIEACRMVEKGERFLELSGRTVAGHMVIKMRNSMKEVRMKNGRFLTMKKDKQMHGIGMEIIEDFVKRYEGNINIQAEKGVFEVIIEVNAY